MNKSSTSRVLQEAAEWLVRLDGEVDANERNAFRAWLEADPEHVEAIERLQGSLSALKGLPREPARVALESIARRRAGRQPLKALALAALMLLPVGLALQQFPPSYLLADIRTSTGQWRTEQLPDGSRISLDGRTAVDLQFDARTRTVRLIQGEIRVDVAKDAARPFRVLTEHGSIRALGTRFVVERLPQATRLAMIESSTEVDSAGKRERVQADQQVRFDTAGPGAPQRIDGSALDQAWDRHQLLVREQPLDQVLERLARNHHGYLLFDAQALQVLQVTAVLPADDSQRALRLLARSLPITLEHYTPWITRVVLQRP
ncbi:FecR domain-containing protein [Pseudomonas sp. GD03860]|uniref:FecR family protein n=1 Tax=Pseudomonas TaxID=286 RepID=UPI002363C8EC|nr:MULTISPECIES: FecR domain-containing protein [Pseudomonas]MDD2060733.1 FecR domain-containing protein [Pseudomonas putida]MDH0637691.1 FecR domain-containing protein [Pseudomonas sp. GD03860]